MSALPCGTADQKQKALQSCAKRFGSIPVRVPPMPSSGLHCAKAANWTTQDETCSAPSPSCQPFLRPTLTLELLILDRKSTRLNSSHRCISYAVFCLKKKKNDTHNTNTPRTQATKSSHKPQV